SARALADGDRHLADAGLSAERLMSILTLRFGQLLLYWDTAFAEGESETSAFSETARKARILQGMSRSILAIHRLQSQRRPAVAVQPMTSSAGREQAQLSAATEQASMPNPSKPVAPGRTPSSKSESGMAMAMPDLPSLLAHGLT